MNMSVLWILAACQVGERVMEIDEPVDSVHLRMSSGEIEVVSVEREGVRIEHEGWCSGEGLALDGGGLFYGADQDCGGELYVEVPLGTPVSVCLDRGEVFVELGAVSDVDVCTAAGEIDLVVPSGDYLLDLDMGAGELSTSGVAHSEAAEHRIRATLAAGELSISGI